MGEVRGAEPELLVVAEGAGPLGMLRGEGGLVGLIAALEARKAVGASEGTLLHDPACAGSSVGLDTGCPLP